MTPKVNNHIVCAPHLHDVQFEKVMAHCIETCVYQLELMAQKI